MRIYGTAKQELLDQWKFVHLTGTRFFAFQNPWFKVDINECVIPDLDFMKGVRSRGNLPQNFHTISLLREKKPMCKEWRLVVSSPDTVAGTVEIPETDMSPVKTMAVLQSAQPGNDNCEGLCEMKVNPFVSVQRNGELDVKKHSDDKTRSLSEGELQTLDEKGEESIAQIPIGSSSSSWAALHLSDKKSGDAEERGHMHLSSTPVKFLIWSNDALSIGIDSVGSNAKRSTEVDI